MNQAEFRCKWLRLEDIWDCAEDVRSRYWSAEKADPNAVLSCISTQLSRPFGVSTDVIERRVDREKLWPPDV